MKHAGTALLSALSLCGLGFAAPAAAQTVYPYGYGTPYGESPTIPSDTGAPAYSWKDTGPWPGATGECEIIAGNHVCFARPDYGYGYGYGYPPPGGPIGAMVAAPFDVAGEIVTAPLYATNVYHGATRYRVAHRTGAPVYRYGRVMPVGSCEIIAGNRVCTP